MIDATAAKITSMHFHGWQRGLKTGMPLAADGVRIVLYADGLHGLIFLDGPPTCRILGSIVELCPVASIWNMRDHLLK